MIKTSKHICYLSALLVPCFAYASTENTDSITSSYDLKEVVVVGERAWIEGNKAIFIPTKHEKNLSTDPASLVERMHIPTVIVDQGSIKSLSGQNVPVYINGVKADGIDLSTFWPKQTIRVEYIDHPQDPKYEGATAVINFVMVEYAVGGVTKVNASQRIPGRGNYNVSSKLVYKNWTFGAMVGGGYTRNHSDSYQGEETYKGILYNGQPYDEISHAFSGHSWDRKNTFNTAANARYRTDKFIMNHTLGFSWNNNPGSGHEDADIWSPSLFNSHSSGAKTTGRSASPQISGAYWYKLNNKWSIGSNWSYSYGRNNNYSIHKTGELDPIRNNTHEDVHSAQLSISPGYLINNNMALMANVRSNMDWFSTIYEGSTNTSQRQWRGMTSANIDFRWQLIQQLGLSISPGISANYWHLYGDKTYTQVQPMGNIHLYLSTSRKLFIMGHLSYFRDVPSATMSGDITIRLDELNRLAANPGLKNSSTWTSGIVPMWMPTNWLRVRPSLNYTRHENEFITVYKAANDAIGGIVKTYANSQPSESLQIYTSLTADLLNNKLSIDFDPCWTFYKARGVYANTLNWFRMRCGAAYNLNNFRVFVTYGGSEKYLTNGGMNINYRGDSFDMGAGYGNGDLYIDLRVNNLFNTHNKLWHKTDAKTYSNIKNVFSTGRHIYINVTYTFGYGKKVDKNIDVTSPTQAKQGTLGNE